jgi:hypothetical protein
MTLSLPAVPAPAVSVGRDQNAGTYSADEEPS